MEKGEAVKREDALKELNDAFQILENAKNKMRISRNNINAIPIAFMRSCMLMMINYGLEPDEAACMLSEWADEHKQMVLEQKEGKL